MSPGAGVGLKHGEKFTGSGFHAWKFNMRMSLIQQEVWSCIEQEADSSKSLKGSDRKTEEEVKKEQLAFTFIMLSLSDSVQAVVRRCKTATET